MKSFTAMSYKMHNISMGLQEILSMRANNHKPMPDYVFVYGYSDMLDEFNSGGDAEASKQVREKTFFSLLLSSPLLSPLLYLSLLFFSRLFSSFLFTSLLFFSIFGTSSCLLSPLARVCVYPHSHGHSHIHRHKVITGKVFSICSSFLALE